MVSAGSGRAARGVTVHGGAAVAPLHRVDEHEQPPGLEDPHELVSDAESRRRRAADRKRDKANGERSKKLQEQERAANRTGATSEKEAPPGCV